MFPSPYAKHGNLGVKWRKISNGIYRDRKNIPEAQHVVDAVIWHMMHRADESLGVVTLNLTQRDLIEDLLDKKLRTFEEGGKFIKAWENQGWPFFIKNLENVQGDERDVIFISTTFGKVQGTDKVRQNFGPISRPDGWRRLNVLFTRARRRVELFSSMAAEDIIVDDKTPLGTRALRDYLDFARRGVLTSTELDDREPDSDFEIAVANVIRSKGYEVKPQLGVAGFYIDMAVRNPDRPGQWLAGVECDGATYHSGFSVRDRDRIRQDILESLGWKGRLYRIWSTDWFFDPRRETEKLLAYLETCRDRDLKQQRQEDSANPWDKDVELVDGKQTVAAVVEGGFGADVDVPDLPSPLPSSDLFVEVGDRVTYCFVNEPDKKQTVTIVEGEGDPKRGLINEKTPVAEALLGLSVGEENAANVPGQHSRNLRVLQIQRQDSLFG